MGEFTSSDRDYESGWDDEVIVLSLIRLRLRNLVEQLRKYFSHQHRINVPAAQDWNYNFPLALWNVALRN
jgi:hypothetical protein